MQIDVVDIEGKKVGQMDLADEVFAVEVKQPLLWEAVKAQQAARRAGTHSTKTREFVRGGGKKPYRQKGTGRARQGSTRAPHYRGGGIVFGPRPRSYAQRLPRQMRRLALVGALTSKLEDDAIRVIDAFGLEEPGTHELVGVLDALGRSEGRVLIEQPALSKMEEVYA